MTFYLEVTTDEYELPLAVAETVGELADLRGVKKNAILKALWKYKNGMTKKCKYIKVEV